MRERIGTMERSYEMRGKEETRTVTWRNTNQLLGIEGYLGMKTGTTRRAGACLVSIGRRGDQELIMVVLGSSDGLGRYVDSRNLYRWAWNELAKQKQRDGKVPF
jgi:D-alanyl-D-alanine carboxypeptidase (penicillin-binding protein 5/6)